MPEELNELSSSDRRQLGDIIANCLGAGTEADRRGIVERNPKFAGMLDSVFAGLDAWNALSPHSLASRASALESLSQPGCGNYSSHDSPDRENLATGDVVVPMLDSRLARGFEVVELIGRGGSGVVYRARLPHEVHGQPDIALKLLRSGVSLDVSKRLRDAQVLKGLDHPNLLRVYWAGESAGHGPFVATEFVEGCNLKQWLLEHSALGEKDAAGIVATLASALEAAHRKHVVHCDIKPENVFGCRGERPDPEALNIGDFGLARYAAAECNADRGDSGLATGGTIGYMAPEQYWGEYDARSDVYALGALMLCILKARKGERAHFLEPDQVAALRSLREGDGELIPTGQRLERVRETFRTNGLMELAGAVDSPPLRRIIAKCLAFDPMDRYQSAAGLAEDLNLWLENRPVQHVAYSYGPLERLSMLIRRCRDRDNVQDHSTLWGMVCLVTGPTAIVLSAISTLLVLLGHDPDWSRTWTSTCYIATWLAIIVPTMWITRCRRPTSQLFGYMLILLVSYITLWWVLAPDRRLYDPIQFLIIGVLFGCLGLSSRQWLLFLYLGLLMIVLSWPVSIAARQPWFDAYGSVLLGIAQGLVLIAFGISYLFPSPSHARKRTSNEPAQLTSPRS